MEVLNAPSSSSIPTQPAPYAGNIPSKPSRSLLERRPTAKKLLSEQVTNATIPLAQCTNLHVASSPSFSFSQAAMSSLTNSTSSTVVRPSRTSQTTLLPFVPLTPIMASPRLTPDIGTAAGSVIVSNVPGGAAGIVAGGSGSGSRTNGSHARSSTANIHKVEGSNPDSLVSAKPLDTTAPDYLNRGRPVAALQQTNSHSHTSVVGSSNISAGQSALPTPSWTSTPPTPPLKGSSPPPPPRLGMSMNPDALRSFSDSSPSSSFHTSRQSSSSRSTSSKSSRSRSGSRGHARPASVAIFPAYRPPSPPSLSLCLSQAQMNSSPTSISSPESISRPQAHAFASPDCASPDSYLGSSPASAASMPVIQPPRSTSTSPQSDLPSTSASLGTPAFLASSSNGGVKRRRTLPRQFSASASVHYKKVFSHSDETVFALHHQAGGSLDSSMGPDGVLLPSLSRTGRSRSIRPKNSSNSPLAVAREDSACSARRRATFIVGDGEPSDNECEERHSQQGREADAAVCSTEPPLLVEEPETLVDSEAQKDERRRTRKYHALLELVTTEVGYLMDLRALVSIYLTQLSLLDAPMPSVLSRPSPSALSISGLGLSRPFPSSRSSFLNHCNQVGIGTGPPDTSGLTIPVERPREAFDRERDLEKEKEKPSRRRLFSDHETEMIARNASELLKLHENFVKLLEKALEPFGFVSAFLPLVDGKRRVSKEGHEKGDLQNVDEAVAVTADLFVQEASSFEVYDKFCPGHNEAADLIRAIQEQHPVEWDAFEQCCSLRVAHAFEPTGTPSTSIDSTRGRDSYRSKRRHSMSSVAMPVPLSPFGAMTLAPAPLSMVGHSKSDPTSGHKRKQSGDAFPGASTQAGRLKFFDYLIKPVQRICKYPLLLDQLKTKRIFMAGESEKGVEAAANTMRKVVAMVDHASERRAHHVKSNVIASRLVSHTPASPTSPVSAEERPAQLTPEFMQSLGACLLAGAMDVLYYQPSGSARAKYLAAFLYVGGYLILAKVPKGGKTYEAKHWFSLFGFEIVDQEDNEALPYTFHLCGGTVSIHFAASCPLEKTIWMTAIQDALSVAAEPWVNEPNANVPPDVRPFVFSQDQVGQEWSTHLPTIQSMSELESPVDSVAPTAPFPSPRKVPKTMSRVDSIVLRQDLQMASLNRRTSTSSVKAFFSPLTSDSRIARPSSQIRQQVDNGLHDVVAESFIAVRSQAQMRDEELFQLRRRPVNVSRSNSALSISGAFTSRRRQDGTFLASKRKGSVDGIADLTGEPETTGKTTNLTTMRRSKSSGGKLRTKQRLSIMPTQSAMLSKLDSETEPMLDHADSESPSSSATSSNANSVLPSPLEMTMPLPTPPSSFYSRSPDTRRGDTRPKRTRSMVDNVKCFFHSRSTSPTPSLQRSPSGVGGQLEPEVDTHGGLIHWWRRGSLRRRSQSSPDAPSDDSAPVTPPASSDDSSHSDLKTPTDHQEQMLNLPSLGTARKVSFSKDPPSLIRRRSLFASATRTDLHSPLSSESGSTLTQSKTLRNIFVFQRSSSTPGDVRKPA